MSLADAVFLNDFPRLRERDTKEPGFARELDKVARELGLLPNFLAAVMSLESGFDPQAVNKGSGATGLIQFMPATAKLFGTTVEALRRMSGIEQLQYVKRFYAPHAKKLELLRDYYLAVFMPKYIGAPFDTVIARKGEAVYDQNAGLDVDQDGTLTVDDVGKKIQDRFTQSEQKLVAFSSVRSSSGPALMALAAGVGGLLFFKTLRLKGKA